MSTPSALLFIALIALVATVIVSPLNAVRRQRTRRSAGLADLEAQRESKYREIRDAELDHSMGKHSEEDYELVDAALRSEALAILQAIEAVQRGQDGEADSATDPTDLQDGREDAGERAGEVSPGAPRRGAAEPAGEQSAGELREGVADSARGTAADPGKSRQRV